MDQSVKEFVSDSYQIISASSPTVPLHGNDTSKGVQFLNELLQFYSGTGLMLTIAKEIDLPIAIGQSIVTFGAPGLTPPADVELGRLANLLDAWLLLDGVTYPLIDENRNVFNASYKYDPQLGLPRFVIIRNDTDRTTMRLYPGASQVYDLHVFAKYELFPVTENDDMSSLPLYYRRFLRLALAKDLSIYKGRVSAWTEQLEEMYLDAKKEMESVSAVNLTIITDNESFLNGHWLVKAGV